MEVVVQYLQINYFIINPIILLNLSYTYIFFLLYHDNIYIIIQALFCFVVLFWFFLLFWYQFHLLSISTKVTHHFKLYTTFNYTPTLIMYHFKLHTILNYTPP